MKFRLPGIFAGKAPAEPPATGPDADALILEGQRLEDSGSVEEALTRYRRALQLEPANARAALNAGNALAALGRSGEALQHYEHAVQIDPGYAAAHFNLGNARLGQGHPVPAAAALRTALQLRPDWAEAHVALGCALEEIDADAAMQSYRRALEIEPGHAGAATNLSDLLLDAGEVDEARRLVDAALVLNPRDRGLRQRLSELLRDGGHPEEAVEVLRQLAEEAPDDPLMPGLWLFNQQYLPDLSGEALRDAHEHFGRRLERRITPLPPTTPEPEESDRVLRVGYLSPDYRLHPVTNFVLPLFRRHDRQQVRVYAYHLDKTVDDITRQCMAAVDVWRSVADLETTAIADQIREDRIDILIDLAGYTAGHRIEVFAYKPAPVQIGWLGYLGTTGLSRMDWRLCDARTDPPGLAEAWQTERPLRLPDSQWCYDPLTSVPGPAPLPRLQRGYWTFGSFNNARKLNNQVLSAWAAVLKAVPDSRLCFYGVKAEAARDWVEARMVEEGIDLERFDLFGRQSLDDYRLSFANVDVALDSFPYNGGTTTCDTLLMGVPVLTPEGTRSLSRGGVSLLATLGLEDWIAKSPDGLAALAAQKLADVNALARLRAELPDRMRASPLMDTTRFARAMEAAYREAWKQACSR